MCSGGDCGDDRVSSSDHAGGDARGQARDNQNRALPYSKAQRGGVSDCLVAPLEHCDDVVTHESAAVSSRARSTVSGQVE